MRWSTTIAIAAGIISAGEHTLAGTRTTISQVSAQPLSGVAPQSAEVAAKPMTPISSIRRRPQTSATRPPSAKVAASATR